MNREFTVVGLIILVIIPLIIVGQVVLIWALNALFGLGIPYTFKTWLAALVLGAAVGGTSAAGNK
jgi:MFS-type transporter involved in bile tolerance (Atg22 family)